MQFQRVSPAQLLVFGPIESVREAAWHALWNARIPLPLIDVEKNIVSGAQGDGVLTVVRVATAHLEARSEGTLVSFDSKPVLGGIDFGAKGRAKKLTTLLESVLERGYVPTFQAEAGPTGRAVAPLADPSGAGAPPIMMGHPLYGPVLAPKRGVTLLCYGLLSLLLCQILAPLTVIYGFSALRDYKRRGDPGDRGLVIAGMVVGSLVTLGILVYIGLLSQIFR